MCAVSGFSLSHPFTSLLSFSSPSYPPLVPMLTLVRIFYDLCCSNLSVFETDIRRFTVVHRLHRVLPTVKHDLLG